MCPVSRLFALVAVINVLMSALAAQPIVDPSGHWEGTVQAPDLAVTIAIDLARNGEGQLAGTFTQPEQGIKGLPLSTITLEGRSLRFVLKPGQGGGTFAATLSDDKRVMAGDFTTNEGGYVLPFTLTRTGEARIAAAPRSAPIDPALTGQWHGAMTVAGKPMRVIVSMTNHPDGTATGTVVSPDGSGVEIPIAITQTAAKVSIDVPSVGASFDGVLNADKTELTGTWRQGPEPLPLVLRRSH